MVGWAKSEHDYKSNRLTALPPFKGGYGVVEGFEVTDRINVIISEHPDVLKAIEGFKDYIKSETLTESLRIEDVKRGVEVEWLDSGSIILDAEVV